MPGGTVWTFADDGDTPSAVVESSDNDNEDKADNSTTTGAQDSTSPDTSVSDGETQGSAAVANTTGTVASAAPSLAPASLTVRIHGNPDADAVSGTASGFFLRVDEHCDCMPLAHGAGSPSTGPCESWLQEPCSRPGQGPGGILVAASQAQRDPPLSSRHRTHPRALRCLTQARRACCSQAAP